MTNLTPNNLLTWKSLNADGSDGDGSLQEYDRIGDLVQGFGSLTWGPDGHFTRTSTSLLVWAVQDDGYIHKLGTDGSDLGHFNASDTLYTTSPFQGGAGTTFIGLGVDSANRVYVFGMDTLDVLHVGRFNADGTDDQTWAITTGWTNADYGSNRFGVDVGREGQYVYAYGPKETVSGVLSHTIYRFDLDAGGTGARLAAIGPYVSLGSTQTYGYVLHGGLAVNPVTGTVAAGVLHKKFDGIGGNTEDLIGYDHLVQEFDPSSGAVVASHHIISGEYDDVDVAPRGTNWYEYGNSTAYLFPMAWDPDGSRLWLWVRFEQMHTRPDQSILCNTVAGEVQDQFWGATGVSRAPALHVLGRLAFPGLSRFNPTTFSQDFFVRT